MRLALVVGVAHAHHAAARAVGHARDHPIVAGQRQAGFRVAKAHHAAARCARETKPLP